MASIPRWLNNWPPAPPTDRSKRAEWLAEREEEVAGLIGRELEGAARKFADRFIGSLTAAGDMTVIGEFEAGWTAFAQNTVADMVVGMHTSGALEVFIQSPTAKQLSAEVVSAWTNIVNQAAVDYAEKVVPMVVESGRAALTDIQSSVLTAVRDGRDVRAVARDIRDMTGVARSRAEAIARTEVVGSFNRGNLAAAEALGADGPMEKEWSAASDARTRPSHVFADGQTVAFNEPFDVDGVPMDAPHDPTAPAEEVVNCRCSVIFLYAGDKRRDGSTVGKVIEPED